MDEIHPNGIEGYADEQERCDAAEDAAARFLAERNELRAAIVKLSGAPLDEISGLVQYNWLDELNDYKERAEIGEPQAGHVFENLQVIAAWLDEVQNTKEEG